MIQLYAIAAVLGGTLLVCQCLMSLAGLGEHHGFDLTHDLAVDHSADSSWLLGIFAFRSIVAGLTFFGMAGLATNTWNPAASFMVAAISGLTGLVLVAVMMQALHKMHSDGTVRIERAVGRPGTVYLTIPPKQSGTGKVSVDVQSRLVEWQAVTKGKQLSTGTNIVVTGIIGPDTVEVVPASQVSRADQV